MLRCSLQPAPFGLKADCPPGPGPVRPAMPRDARGPADLRGARGFTLVEVLIALAIVAITLPAVLLTLDQQIDGTAYLRDKSLAQVVAQNRLAELRLGLRGGRRDLRGTLNGVETMADRDWYWRIETTGTQVNGFARVAVIVSLEEGEDTPSLVTLVAYLAGTNVDGGG